MKAENRPMTGLNGEVAQLLLIPGNVRLQDLQTYTTQDQLHRNWFGPDMQYANPYYVRHRFQIVMSVGVPSVTMVLMST